MKLTPTKAKLFHQRKGLKIKRKKSDAKEIDANWIWESMSKEYHEKMHKM